MTLDNLDGGDTKTKRETDNYTEEDIANEINEDKTEQETNFEVNKSIEHIKLPKKIGSPAFSIHAEKVYILYPSLFQDPNIFGRLSIPQNVNLDPSADKTSKESDKSSRNRNSEFPEALPLTSSKKLTRRQASNPTSSDGRVSAKKEELKKNVETHLTGSIVVLNQDVNEVNQKAAY